MGAKGKKNKKKKNQITDIYFNFEDDKEDEKKEEEMFNGINEFKDDNPFNFKVDYDDEKDKFEEPKYFEEDEEEIKEEEIKEKEIINKKCSLEDHKEIDAIYFCQECKISMCKKCEKDHTRLLKNHHMFSLDQDINEVFTGLCTKPNHSLKLEYFCKSHNQLCCAACIAKVKNKWNGQHKDCEIYYILKIKNKVKQNMDKNMKKLEELYKNVEPNIKDLKDISEKINESKEQLKGKIQKIFTKLRNELNNREDKLYEEIDKKYNELFFCEDLIKESEKLPNLLKTTLEKGKINKNNWDNEDILPKLFNDNIKFENVMKNIDDIYDKIKVFYSTKDTKIDFSLTDDEIDKNWLNKIKRFGGISVLDEKDIDFFAIKK